MFSLSKIIAAATPAHAVKGKAKAATGYAAGRATYGEWANAQRFAIRALIAAGEAFDKYLRPAGAPTFPKDAPLMQPNCGVVALAMFTSRSYADTVAIFARTRSASWTGGTHTAEYAPAALELGFATEVKAAPRMSLGKFADTTKGKPQTHFCTVDGHAVAVWDGLIFDQNYPAGATPAEHFTAHKTVKFHMVRA